MGDLDSKYVKGAKTYFEHAASDPSGDWNSWWLCHKAFCEFMEADAPEDCVDNLALNLGFYLASWGMYRSSFLTRKDYTVHKEAVRILTAHKDLMGIGFDEFADKEVRDEIIKLESKLKKSYEQAANDVAEIVAGEASHIKAATGKSRTFSVTDTLTTKVMLGTLACCPAFDLNFKQAETALGIGKQDFSEKSLAGLAALCDSNKEQLEELRESLRITAGHPCPDMKALDLLLWHIGRSLPDSDKK